MRGYELDTMTVWSSRSASCREGGAVERRGCAQVCAGVLGARLVHGPCARRFAFPPPRFPSRVVAGGSGTDLEPRGSQSIDLAAVRVAYGLILSGQACQSHFPTSALSVMPPAPQNAVSSLPAQHLSLLLGGCVCSFSSKFLFLVRRGFKHVIRSCSFST